MSKKKAIIVGAGGLGKIVYDVLKRDFDFLNQYFILGFLDTRTDLKLPDDIDRGVVGSPLSYQAKEGEIFIPAIGDPRLRRQLLVPLIEQGAEFFSYVNRASVSSGATIGQGVFLTPGVVISTNCTIGDYSYVDTYAILGHDVQVGKYCMIGAMSFLAGGVVVQDGVAMHPRATIAKNLVLGNDCTVGIGSVVVKDVSPNVTVFGNPARNIF